jgi:hypothetical protein
MDCSGSLPRFVWGSGQVLSQRLAALEAGQHRDDDAALVGFISHWGKLGYGPEFDDVEKTCMALENSWRLANWLAALHDRDAPLFSDEDGGPVPGTTDMTTDPRSIDLQLRRRGIFKTSGGWRFNPVGPLPTMRRAASTIDRRHGPIPDWRLNRREQRQLSALAFAEFFQYTYAPYLHSSLRLRYEFLRTVTAPAYDHVFDINTPMAVLAAKTVDMASGMLGIRRCLWCRTIFQPGRLNREYCEDKPCKNRANQAAWRAKHQKPRRGRSATARP